MELNNDEIRRCSRHLILPEVGLAGQKKIKESNVLCIGKIGIVDFDTVDYSHRKTPHLVGQSQICVIHLNSCNWGDNSLFPAPV